MEQAGRKTVLPVRAAISTGRKKIEDMQGVSVGDRVNVAVETNKNSNEKMPGICKHGLTDQWVSISTITSRIHPILERERRKS